MYIHSWLLPVLACGSAQATLSREPPGPGYGVEQISWLVEVFEGKPNHILNGTVQEVQAQARALNPHWKPKPKPANGSSVVARTEPYPPLTKNLVCNNWPAAECTFAYEGINYLNEDVTGSPANGPGPGNCGRVSCSYDTAIWWCNDNTYTFSLPNFGYIGYGAQLVARGCGCNDDYYSVQLIDGQQFFQSNWNVILRGDSC